MKLFETHAHLDLPDFNADRESLINKCFESGIEYIINIGFNKETSLNSLELAKKHLHIFATVGFHPHDAMDFDAELIKRLVRDKNVLAIGEVGLDFPQLFAYRCSVKFSAIKHIWLWIMTNPW